MKLMTKEIEKKIPKLYSQDGKGYDAIVHVKYFDPLGSSAWFGTEYDKEQRLFFGWACLNGNIEDAELGYFSLDQIENTRIERDMYFAPCSLKKAIKDKYGIDV